MCSNVKMAIERERLNYSGKLNGKPLEVRKLCWLSTPRIKPEMDKKLSRYWSGPYEIMEKISDVLSHIWTKGDWNREPLELVAGIDRLKRCYDNQEQESGIGIYSMEMPSLLMSILNKPLQI